MANIRQSLPSFTLTLPHLRSLAETHPLSTLAALGLVPLLAYATNAYRGYIALGPGGMPYNLGGWLFQALLQIPARHNITDTSLFRSPANDALYGPLGRKSFIRLETLGSLSGPLPPRSGTRPTVPGYVAPQRQTDGWAADKKEAMAARLQTYLIGLVGANAGVFAVRPSALEGGTAQAIWMRTLGDESVPMPDVLKGIKAEVAHVHGEGSTHMVLSLTDAEEAVKKGWAVKHKLSGLFGKIPLTYVFVYAPRSEAEFEVWRSLLKASCAFVSGGKEIADPRDE